MTTTTDSEASKSQSNAAEGADSTVDFRPLRLLKFQAFATLHGNASNSGLPTVTISVAGEPVGQPAAPAPETKAEKHGFRRFQMNRQPADSVVYRHSDGSIESRRKVLPDGSTRETRYYQPTDKGVTRQSDSVTSPDGGSSYAGYSKDGSLEMIQGTSTSGQIATFNSREDGLFQGSVLNNDGSIAEATFGQFKEHFLRLVSSY